MNPKIIVVSALLASACSSSAPSGPSSSSPMGDSSPAQPASLVGSAATGAPGSGSCVPAAPATFANAVCVCTDLAEAGVLRTHASANGAASVGVNGRFAAATGSDIEGALVAYQGLAVAGDLAVRNAAASTADLSGAGKLHVGGDLSVGGALAFAGDLNVSGALRLAQPGLVLPGAFSGSTAAYVAPAGPPCACDPGALLPIAQSVTDAASKNDNAAHGLGVTGADLLGAGGLSLSSGRYYFKDVTRVGKGTISIHGAVSIFIDGSIDEVGSEQITLDAGASLDLYVSGIIATAGSVALGDPAHPEAFRLFVGGAGSTLATAGRQVWNGLVYAPEATIAFAGVTRVNGAIFAKSLDWAGILDVTYEGAGSVASCPPPSSGSAGPVAPPK